MKLTNEQWELIEPRLPKYEKKDPRKRLRKASTRKTKLVEKTIDTRFVDRNLRR